MARNENFTTAGSGTAWENTGFEIGAGEEVIVQSISGTGTHRAAVAVEDEQPTGLVGVQIQNSAGSPNTITLRGPGTIWARNVTPATAVSITLTMQSTPASGT